VVHSLKNHEVIDRQQSVLTLIHTGKVAWIDKLVIDYEKLAAIPLEDRLLFKMGETSTVWLWHESIVELLESIQPLGIYFRLADGYSMDNIFQP
jgi:hypothetical protein